MRVVVDLLWVLPSTSLYKATLWRYVDYIIVLIMSNICYCILFQHFALHTRPQGFGCWVDGQCNCGRVLDSRSCQLEVSSRLHVHTYVQDDKHQCCMCNLRMCNHMEHLSVLCSLLQELHEAAEHLRQDEVNKSDLKNWLWSKTLEWIRDNEWAQTEEIPAGKIATATAAKKKRRKNQIGSQTRCTLQCKPPCHTNRSWWLMRIGMWRKHSFPNSWRGCLWTLCSITTSTIGPQKFWTF